MNVHNSALPYHCLFEINHRPFTKKNIQQLPFGIAKFSAIFFPPIDFLEILCFFSPASFQENPEAVATCTSFQTKICRQMLTTVLSTLGPKITQCRKNTVSMCWLFADRTQLLHYIIHINWNIQNIHRYDLCITTRCKEQSHIIMWGLKCRLPAFASAIVESFDHADEAKYCAARMRFCEEFVARPWNKLNNALGPTTFHQTACLFWAPMHVFFLPSKPTSQQEFFTPSLVLNKNMLCTRWLGATTNENRNSVYTIRVRFLMFIFTASTTTNITS